MLVYYVNTSCLMRNFWWRKTCLIFVNFQLHIITQMFDAYQLCLKNDALQFLFCDGSLVQENLHYFCQISVTFNYSLCINPDVSQFLSY